MATRPPCVGQAIGGISADCPRALKGCCCPPRASPLRDSQTVSTLRPVRLRLETPPCKSKEGEITPFLKSVEEFPVKRLDPSLQIRKEVSQVDFRPTSHDPASAVIGPGRL
jgi:hypothetical protein